MRRILSLFLLTIFSHCARAQMAEVTMQFLQGQWTLTSMNQDDRCLPAMEYVPRMPSDNKWIIKGDSISLYNYPSAFLGKYEFSLRNDSLFISASYRVEVFPWRKSFYAVVRYDSGNLVLSMPECITMKFKRDTFNTETLRLITVLDRDTLNPYLLVRKYTMITHFVPDDAEAYDRFPPVQMKSVIFIKDSTAARRMIHSDSITLSVNGKLRKFHVEYIEWHGWHEWRPDGIPRPYKCEPEIVITPGDWWKEDSFRVHYRAKEAE